MTVKSAFIAALVWLLLVLLAIANGLIRDKLLAPAIGTTRALPISGLTLSLMILIAGYLAVPLFGVPSAAGYLAVGLQWVGMTLAFELLFGRYALRKPWPEVLRVFNPAHGDLFIVVLAITFTAPYLAAKIRGIL